MIISMLCALFCYNEQLSLWESYLGVLKSNVTYFYEGCYIISEERFRRRLTEYEKDNGDLQLRLSETETVMLTKDSEITTLRKKLKQLEKQNDTLQHANNVYQLEREQLEREVRKTDLWQTCDCLKVPW